jgi:hypothetical protein
MCLGKAVSMRNPLKILHSLRCDEPRRVVMVEAFVIVVQVMLDDFFWLEDVTHPSRLRPHLRFSAASQAMR